MTLTRTLLLLVAVLALSEPCSASASSSSGPGRVGLGSGAQPLTGLGLDAGLDARGTPVPDLGIPTTTLSNGVKVPMMGLGLGGHSAVPDLGIPTTNLSNGVAVPMVGLGTWQYLNEEAYEATLLALRLGYVHLDTAQNYHNQLGLGRALEQFLKESGTKRERIFLTTKIPGGLSERQAAAALQSNLEKLGVDYVDLVLVHFPAAWNRAGGPALRLAGWRAMDAFYKAGKARAIGVSHFCERHLRELLGSGLTPPHVNQVEFHVGMGSAGPNATDDRDFCTAHGILFEGFSPLCGPCGTSELITGDMVTSIGKKHGKTGAQVSLRWQVQQGIVVIPKTNTTKHLLQNADLFSWTLSDDDMATLTGAKTPAVTGGGDGVNSGDCSVV